MYAPLQDTYYMHVAKDLTQPNLNSPREVQRSHKQHLYSRDSVQACSRMHPSGTLTPAAEVHTSTNLHPITFSEAHIDKHRESVTDL